jgi:serine/threonine protein kinase
MSRCHGRRTDLEGVNKLRFDSDQQDRKEEKTSKLQRSIMDSALKYKLLEQVGNGSFGVVYKAVNKDSGEVVAIKEACGHHFKADAD